MRAANVLKALKNSFTVKVFVVVALLNVALLVFLYLKKVQLKQHLDVIAEKPLPLTSEETIEEETILVSDSPLQEIERLNPNLPIVFWDEKKHLAMKINATCANLPDIFFLDYDNMYWQKLKTSNGTFFMIGAYKDVRKKNPRPSVRILTMLDTRAPRVNTTCQLWFDEKNQPSLSPVVQHNFIWHKEWGYAGAYQPYLLNCVIPPEDVNKTVRAVSLVEKPCDTAENLLKVTYKPAQREKDVAVCVRGMHFPSTDLSVRLIEWIELVRLLGADKIFFYTYEIHPNATKVFEYYKQKGLVEVTPVTLPGKLPNGPYLQHYYLYHNVWLQVKNELMQLNDCFYTHMYEYKYIMLLDIDEIIMPVHQDTWRTLLKAVLPKAARNDKTERASISARNVYFLDDLLHNHGWFDDVPRYMHMLQHVYRARKYTPPGHYIKSFHNTELVVTVHNHYPVECFGYCMGYELETSDAQLQHYRSDCPWEIRKECKEFRKNSVLDTTIWRYKKALIRRVSLAMMDLGYFDT